MTLDLQGRKKQDDDSSLQLRTKGERVIKEEKERKNRVIEEEKARKDGGKKMVFGNEENHQVFESWMSNNERNFS